MKSANSFERIWEIDFLRGLSIILMVFDHLFFDLITMYNIHIPLVSDSLSGLFVILQFFFAGLFIFLSGISSSFSKSNIKRGLKLCVISVLLTSVTFLMAYLKMIDNNIIILFGILHFLSICMLLSSFLIKINRYVLLLFSAIVISLSPLVDYMNSLNIDNNYFAILGIHNSNFSSGDYFPLIPWLGIFVIGISFCKIFYKEKKSLIKYPLKPNIINYAGRNSLLIYLLHQPILLIILRIIFGY